MTGERRVLAQGPSVPAIAGVSDKHMRSRKLCRWEQLTSFAILMSLEVCQMAWPSASMCIPAPTSFCCLIPKLRISMSSLLYPFGAAHSMFSMRFRTISGESVNLVDLLIPEEGPLVDEPSSCCDWFWDCEPKRPG